MKVVEQEGTLWRSRPAMRASQETLVAATIGAEAEAGIEVVAERSCKDGRRGDAPVALKSDLVVGTRMLKAPCNYTGSHQSGQHLGHTQTMAFLQLNGTRLQ